MIKIKSKNKDFFSVIQKNPEYLNGIYPMRIKKGVALGMVDSEKNEYNVLFQDTKYSYAEDMSNQIDFQSFCNARLVLDVLSEGFKSALMSDEEYLAQKTPWLGEGKTIKDIDVPNDCSIEFFAYVDSNWVNKEGGGIFTKYFEEVHIEHFKGKAYKITISGNMTIFRLLNLTALICMFITVINPQKWAITESLIEKYIRIMDNIGNVPYFIVYLFKVRVLYHNEYFDKYKPDLERIIGQKVNLTFGNTHDARLSYICNEIDGKVSVLDVGCGEFLYAKRIMRGMDKNAVYYAHDREDWNIVANAINSRYKATLLFSQYLDQLIKKIGRKQVDVILTEVIEHNDKEEAKQLILKLLNNLNIRKFIVTSVNKDFNVHYELENDTRHEDHKFEMHMDEFMGFFDEVLVSLKKKYDLDAFQYIQIGDSLAGEAPTQGILYLKPPSFIDNVKNKITKLFKKIFK